MSSQIPQATAQTHRPDLINNARSLPSHPSQKVIKMQDYRSHAMTTNSPNHAVSSRNPKEPLELGYKPHTPMASDQQDINPD